MNIARLSKKAPWLRHAISGSLKINKLQAMENKKKIEFGVFRQPQQLHAPFKNYEYTKSSPPDKPGA